MHQIPSFENVALAADYEFFTKYLALSRDQQEHLHRMVDAMLEDRSIFPD